jgi:hypothetical protein
MIKDWWYAIKVCRKYKITWNPFCKIDRGTYHWYGIVWMTDSPTISTNPFDKHFKEIFFHEVGHHVAKRIGYEKKCKEYFNSVPKKEQITMQGHPYYILLDEEAFASRFARKALKGCMDSGYLVKCFQTYTSRGYKTPYVDSIKLTDQVSRLIRRIEK